HPPLPSHLSPLSLHDALPICPPPRSLCLLPYQDDFETPGISPRSANPRKHRRQMPNFRRYPRGLPHSLQRLCRRVENLGFWFLRSEEHTSELQSLAYLVCRLL